MDETFGAQQIYQLFWSQNRRNFVQFSAFAVLDRFFSAFCVISFAIFLHQFSCEIRYPFKPMKNL